jgi:hypothetical protein
MFAVTITLGIVAIGAIATAPLYAGRVRRFGSARLGAALVTLAIGLALLCTATPGASAETKSEVFVCSFFLMLAGAVLVLGRDDPDGGSDGGGDDDPPWWPEFERDFRSYARRSRPLARIR